MLLAAVVYANSFPGAFIQDDIHIVERNRLVIDFDLFGIFTSDYWTGMENSGLYRPLTVLSFAINRLLLGEAPWGFHLVNLLLHAGVAVLLWLALRRWQVPAAAAFLASAFFALHPIHAEVVNEAVGRSELLVALLLLLAVYAARDDGRRAYAVTLLCYGLAQLAKEHAIVLLGLLPLLDAYAAGSFNAWRRRCPLYAGLCAVAGGWLLLRHFAVVQVGAPSLYSTTAVPLAYVPWDVRVLTALQYQWVYLGILLAPWKLQSVYSLADLPPLIVSPWSVAGGLVMASVVLVVALVVLGWRRRQWWALFVALYAVSFAPTANVIFPIGVTMAERLAYLPSVWFCAGIGILGGAFVQRESTRKLAWLLCGLYALFLAGVGIDRNRDFDSEIHLWSREVQINERDYLGWQSYAESLNGSRRYEEAERAYARLLELKPDFQGALRSYVAFLTGRGQYEQALAPAGRALQLATEQGDLAGMAYDLTNLAHIYVERKEFDRALEQLRRPEASGLPDRDFYYGLLGRAHEGRGEYAAAVQAFSQVKGYNIDLNIPLHYGLSLFQLGRLDEARDQLELATRLNERPEAWNLLGTVHARKGDMGRAATAFGRAVELAPENRYYRENLERARQMTEGRPTGVR